MPKLSSLKLKVVLYSMTMIILAVFVSTYLAYEKSKTQLQSGLANELLAIANSTALFIDPNLQDEIVRIDEDLVEGMQAFKETRVILDDVKKANELNDSSHGSPIYTLRTTERFPATHVLEFVVMTDKGSDGEYYIGNTIPAEPHHLAALQGIPTATEIYQDSEGTWISAAAPIVYEDGEVAGLVQVDRNVEFFYKEAFAVAKSLAIGASITTLVVAILTYFSSGLVTKPLKLITQAAKRLGEGNFEQKIEMDRNDEIGLLANTFNKMIVQLDEDKKIKREQRIELEKLAENLEEANSNLEKKVDERTEDLRKTNKELEVILLKLKKSQASLVQSEKMASLGQLAAGVAHEINNPMAFITSNMKTLKDYVESLLDIGNQVPELSKAATHDDIQEIKRIIGEFAKIYEEEDVEFIGEDAPELLDESIKGANRVKEIVKNLKGFSRVDNEGMATSDINECVTSSIKVAHNETKNNCEVITDFSDLPEIQCNPGKLNQVFLNVIVNAAHAIEDQGTVIVKTYSDQNFIYVDITDNGCGIPQENIDKLFDAFFTTKPVGKGTGLGLYISFGIIEEHNGSINIQSVVGEGTTFQIQLPIKQPATSSEEEKVAA